MNKSEMDVYRTLTADRIAIVTLLTIESALFCLWQAMVYVTGFALYTIAPGVVQPTGWAHTVSHLGWWAIIEFVVITIGWAGNGYSLQQPRSKKLQLSMERAANWSLAHFIALIIAAGADITDIVLTGLEINDAESTFYVDSFGFLVAFLVVLILQLVFIKGALIWKQYEYRRHLCEVLQGAISVFDMPTAPSNASIETPLLNTMRRGNY